jgi:hypothetical protein
MIAKLIFTWMLLKGSMIEQMPVDNRKTYILWVNDSTFVDGAYKGEVLNWLRTGTFVYNEDLPDK